MAAPRLSLGHRAIFNQLLRIVKEKESLIPGAEVRAKEYPSGETVLAIVIPPRDRIPGDTGR